VKEKMAEPLTKTQQHALEQIKKQFGNGWFEPEGNIREGEWVSGVRGVRRPDYVCRTLHEKGYLEREVFNTDSRIKNLASRYRVKSDDK
jgi:hypothetical protein